MSDIYYRGTLADYARAMRRSKFVLRLLEKCDIKNKYALSVCEQLNAGGIITDKQIVVLKKIIRGIRRKAMSNRMDRSLERLEAKRKLINRIRESIDDSGELTDWECEFLDSILNQLLENRRQTLTDGQVETLEKIEFKRAEGIDAYWDEYGEHKEY